MSVFESFEEDYQDVEVDDQCLTADTFCLIGNIDSPYLIFCDQGNAETMVDNFTSYLGFQGNVLGKVKITSDQVTLFEFIIGNNYGLSSSANFLYNHSSLWDLFQIKLTETQRHYLSCRFKNFHTIFEHDFSDQFATFPDFFTPYWHDGKLFPILFRQRQLAEGEVD
jgi:hypothetical protein